MQRFVYRLKRAFYPPVIAVVGDELDPEFQARIEARHVASPVAVDKPAPPCHRKSLAAQQPLVELHLALVAVLPIGIERHLGHLGGGLVVHHYQLPRLLVMPQVIYGAEQLEPGRLVGSPNTPEVVAPILQLRMRVRDCVDIRFDHERMGAVLDAVTVELAFEQGVHCRIQVEGEPCWSRNAQASVEVETAPAIDEQFYLRAA